MRKGIGSKPSQVLFKGLIFNVHDAGVASCLDAKDGSDLGLFDFDSQAKLEIDKEDNISVILVAHDNDSFPIIGGSNVEKGEQILSQVRQAFFGPVRCSVISRRLIPTSG